MASRLFHAGAIVLVLVALLPGRPLGAASLRAGLPAGLDDRSAPQDEPPPEDSAPPLPPGLGGGDQEPALPPGLGDEPETPSEPEDERRAERRPLYGLTGFWDLRAGPRLEEDRLQEDFILGELRLQLSRTWYTDAATVTLTGDLLYDAVADDRSLDVERGRGWLDLREASVLLRPVEFADLKIGRQILTWGVGDLVFLNDLFPKDYVSFFAGRDVEYLKAPSDAVRLSLFGPVNLDLVYTPRFDPDRFLTGERLSLYNPVLGRRSGDDAVLSPRVPDEWLTDDEIAARLYRQIGAFELAAYGYRGFWKSPRGVSPEDDLVFPALSVWGASLRGPAAGGIASAEIAYYDSREDPAGTDPLLPNSEWRTLVGFEREVAPELTLGVQYYTEITQDYGALERNLPPGASAGEHVRHTLTVRLTRLAMQQRLTLGAFNFWSPDGDDGHLRLEGRYELSDAWLLQAGLNLFYGTREDGFFGQFEDDSHAYLAVRRGF